METVQIMIWMGSIKLLTKIYYLFDNKFIRNEIKKIVLYIGKGIRINKNTGNLQLLYRHKLAVFHIIESSFYLNQQKQNIIHQKKKKNRMIHIFLFSI